MQSTHTHTHTVNYIENYFFLPAGIETIVLYWPVKLRENGRVLFFRLEIWDCGENALRRFDHLLPVSITYNSGMKHDLSDVRFGK